MTASLNYALTLQQAGDLREAEAICTAILQAEPQNPDALYLLGTLRLQLDDSVKAERLLAEIPKHHPRFPDSLYHRSIALRRLGRGAEGVARLDELLSLRPHFLPALLERGAALFRLRRYEEALANYDKALAIDSSALLAMDRRADALFHLGRYQEANEQYERLLARDPHAPYVRGRLVFDKLHRCDWTRIADHERMITNDLQAGRPAVSPGEYIAFSHSPGDQLQCAHIWTAHQCPPASDALWRGEQYRHDRIRLAYLSQDFRFHPVTAQLVGVIESHDKRSFEPIGISFGDIDQSEMCTRLMAAFEKFAVVQNRGDAEVARFLKENEVDIAVDLMGHTGGSRPRIFALRPAPVQINFLGFPGTTGAAYLDYVLADPIVIPPAEQAFYSERVVYLRDTYFPADSKRTIGASVPSRAEASLPEEGFVFCSFNNSFKYSPETFDVWMRLLREVEKSVLWLPKPNDDAAANLRREAQARGVGADRLIFAPFVPNPAEHLARLRLGDLFLDTIPYNAHSSACDALWAGLPVLTCRGTTFAGRVASSVLSAIGLPELIASSLEEYERVALKLARDTGALSELRAKLASNGKSQPLFDTERYTRQLEAAYRHMWHRSRQGLPPETFAAA